MCAKPLRLAVFLRVTALLLLLALFGGVGRVGGQTYSRVPAKNSELCTVCGAELTSDDVTLIVRGRRTPLCRAHVETFLNDLERSFYSQQPRGALFQEDLSAPPGTAQGGISQGWFLFGLLVLSSLIFGGLSGYRALSMDSPPLAPFFIGFFLNLPGFLYVISRRAGRDHGQVPRGLVKVPETAAPAPCPACGEVNHPTARQCLACGKELAPSQQSEVTRA
ncbi:MAG: zinc ribbon domain-containing protein [Acidobacteria bacterium]|nr:zinc ribbon domain-containing protein [Acidobacteriota bacterium]